ncbi:Chromosome-partitioning protein Spo0J [compost metagenome]
MSKSIKALLAQQAAANLQQHREADYEEEFDVGRQHTKIPLDRIIPNRFQPRIAFAEEGIRDLAESIAQIGLTQPITVRAHGKDYELIAGERRLRAHRLLNKATIEAIVVDADDGQAAAMALSENIDREGLTDFEISEGMRQLEEKFPKRSHLAKALNLARSELYRYLAFRELPPAVIERLRKAPDLIGRRAASDIAQALKDSPAAAERLDEALNLIEEGKLEQGRVAAFLQQPAAKPASQPEAAKPIILKQGKARIGTIARTPTDLVIKVSHQALPQEKAERLQTFLRELLEEGA